MKDTQGLNFFGYVKGNPLKYTDPDGLDYWAKNSDGYFERYPGKAPRGARAIKKPVRFKAIAGGKFGSNGIDATEGSIIEAQPNGEAKIKWMAPAKTTARLAYAPPRGDNGPGYVEGMVTSFGQKERTANDSSFWWFYNTAVGTGTRTVYGIGTTVYGFGLFGRLDKVGGQYARGSMEGEQAFAEATSAAGQAAFEAGLAVVTGGESEALEAVGTAGRGARSAISGGIRAGEKAGERFAFGEAATAASSKGAELLDESVTALSRGSSEVGDELVTVYRVQPVTQTKIVTGGAFRRLREAGQDLVEANQKRLDLLRDAFHSNPNRRIRALESAQASGKKSPFISTTLDEDVARNAFDAARAEGRNMELVTIQGPRSGGVDFEATFDLLGGRKSPGRLKDADLKEFGIFDLFIPARGQSRSGFRIIGRE